MMSAIPVVVSYQHRRYRFTLLRSPSSTEPLTFSLLCDALVQHLHLPYSCRRIVDSHRAPILILAAQSGTPDYQDEVERKERFVRLRGDIDLRDAIAASPSQLRLRVETVQPSSSMDNPTPVESAVTSAPSSSTTTRASTPTLLRIFSHLQKHASSAVGDALDDLSQVLEDHPKDVAALRDARHRISRLVASFLHHLNTRPEDYRISKALHQQLVARFDEIARDIDLSDDTLIAIHDAIRATTSCRFAVSLIRDKYRELVPDDVVETPETPPKPQPPPSTVPPVSTIARSDSHVHMPRRPLKHYFNHYNRLIRVASDDVKTANARLMRYQTRLDARGVELPDWTVSMCRSIERAIFHVARVHVESGPKGSLTVEPRAITSLGASVSRKLVRAGFPQKFADRAGNLAQLMAQDDAVVCTVVDWSKKRLARLAADRSTRRQNVAVLAPVIGLSVPLVPENSAGSGDAGRVSRVTDASGASRSGSQRDGSSSRLSSRQRSLSSARSSSASSSTSRSSSSTSRSNRSTYSDDGPVRFRTSCLGSNASSKSLQHRDSMHRFTPDEQLDLRNDHVGAPNDSEVSEDEVADEPLYATELNPNPYAYPTNDPGVIYAEEDRNMATDSDASDDTSLSQWARVEMEKERQQREYMAREYERRADQVQSPLRRMRQPNPRQQPPDRYVDYSPERSVEESLQKSHDRTTDNSIRRPVAHSESERSEPVQFTNQLQRTNNSVRGGSLMVGSDDDDYGDEEDRDNDQDELEGDDDDADSLATNETVQSRSLVETGSLYAPRQRATPASNWSDARSGSRFQQNTQFGRRDSYPTYEDDGTWNAQTASRW